MAKVNSGWHSLSHHREDKNKIDQLQRIDQYEIDQFAYFLKRLKETREGDGNLLDNSMIVYGSGLGDGNRHRHGELPIVFAGHGAGTIKAGRHIRFGQETPLNNLFLAMLHRMGADMPRFGDSTGVLKEIDA